MKQNFDVEELKTRPLISLTAEENSAVLIDAFLTAQRLAGPSEVRQKETNYVYGIDGLCRLLSCSYPTAQKIKNSLPKDCYSQVGRKIIFYEQRVLMALKSK